METAPRFRIVLAKEDFKFSAAHFTLFGDGRAETLHGHNYRIRLELGGRELNGLGLLADLECCKRSVRALCRVPLVASGGAGTVRHFAEVFQAAEVDAALAASVFHSGEIAIPDLKRQLRADGIEVRA